MENDSRNFAETCIPVMTCAEAKSFEEKFFSTQEMTEEVAMNAAGTLIGERVFRECGAEKISRVLVLAGKGHNGGDAVCAATRIFSQTSCRVALVFFAENEDALAPLTRRFLERFVTAVPAEKYRITFLSKEQSSVPVEILSFAGKPHVLLDGIFGHGFRPPFPQNIRTFLKEIFSVRPRDAFCCSVDLPSGLCDDAEEEAVVCADFTFPTGILKYPILAHPKYVGRIIPVSLGFREWEQNRFAVADHSWFLKKLFSRRPAFCDKRDFGHVLIVGGSRSMPGALMLNVLAALRAGVGLVSVICPERVQSAFAARAPGAMWIPCAENTDGGLACEDAFSEFQKILSRVSVVLCGSGMGDSENSQALVQKIAKSVPREIPLILDADALRKETLFALKERGAPSEKTILLPHKGEFLRLGGQEDSLREFCREYDVSLILKGACTSIVDTESEILTFAGTPVLARGGSGDVLAGLFSAVLAAEKNFDAKSTSRERFVAAVVWHGTAARRLSLSQGERCADISALPEFLNLKE